MLLLSAIQKLSGACIMLIHAYKQVIYIIPIVNQTSYSKPRESTRVMDDSTSVTPSASPASSITSTPAGTLESTPVILPDLTRGPLGMIGEVFHVRDRLAATAVVQFISLFCCSFQTFMNKCVCSVWSCS